MRLTLFSVGYAGLWGQSVLGMHEFLDKAARLGYDGVMLAGKRPHLSPLDTTPKTDRTAPEHPGAHRAALRGCRRLYRLYGRQRWPRCLIPRCRWPTSNRWRGWRRPCSAGSCASSQRMKRRRPPREDSGRAWSRRCGNAATVPPLTESRLPCRITMTWPYTPQRSWNCSPTSIGPTASSVSTPGRPPFAARNLYEAARRAAPHTVITTNADYIRLPQFAYQPAQVNYRPVLPDLVRAVPFGQGFIDYPAFFRGLIDGGFDGVATYEMCSPLRGGGSLDNLDRCAAHYLTWMRENLTARSG